MKYGVGIMGLGIALLGASYTARAANELQGIYHHQGSPENAQASIEYGKVVFYFSQEPVVKQSEKTQKHMRTIELFFPQITITPAAQQMLVAFAGKKSPMYSVKIAMVKKPQRGVMCTITYDEEQVVYTYEACESIKLQKGIVLTFYNKALLARIALAQKGVLRTAAAQKPTVIIDAGHGGSDTGACSLAGVMEKDVALSLGLMVAQLLRNDGIDVFLTRTTDTMLPLDSRTTCANSCARGNLFVSLHANAGGGKVASGIETFFLASVDGGLSDGAPLPYAREIQSFKKGLADKGKLLAQLIQQNTLHTLHQASYGVVDRHIKPAVAQVLIGAHMPAALIEVGFLSHEKEASLLATADYQRILARGIYAGIKDYLNQRRICA